MGLWFFITFFFHWSYNYTLNYGIYQCILGVLSECMLNVMFLSFLFEALFAPQFQLKVKIMIGVFFFKENTKRNN